MLHITRVRARVRGEARTPLKTSIKKGVYQGAERLVFLLGGREGERVEVPRYISKP